VELVNQFYCSEIINSNKTASKISSFN